MRVSREQMAEHRRQILDAASKLFREKGFEAVTVADVMAAAGLTHGGFYRHFASKDALIAAAIAEALDRAAADRRAFPAYLAGYLSKAHRDHPGEGCPVAGLGPAAIREGAEARAAMTEGLRRQIARFAKEAPGKTPAAKRQAAIAAWSAMVGALILARLADDETLSDEILTATRKSIATRAAN
ncbi:TetR/AcrR family transcriptional regulator [Dongia sp.]|uniref:TetR/AcrR family transcriptional regulator n=1 Tax=Dongia sp. TaxID=1977262 RepID=UPI0035B2B2B3